MATTALRPLSAQAHGLARAMSTAAPPHALKITKGPGGRSSVSNITATVFGNTGFIGRYVVSRLGRRGSQVVIPFRGDEHDHRHLRVMGDLGQILPQEFKLFEPQTVVDAVKYSDVVINLIGRDANTRHFSLQDSNVSGPSIIAQACAEAGVKQLIHVSALNADPSSKDEYLKTKGLGEEAVLKAFPDATIFRPSNVYGVEDRFLNRFSALRQLPIVGVPLVNGGAAVKQPVYVIDLAKAIEAAVDNPEYVAGRTVEVVGPKQYTIKQLVDYVCKSVRRSNNAKTVPFLSVFANMAEMVPFLDPVMNAREVHTWSTDDQVTPGTLRLEDLGVEATQLEKVALTVLRRYRSYLTHGEVSDA